MNKQQFLFRIFWIGALLLSTGLSATAQQFVFATLDGAPTMDTTGWNLAGDATIADTPGDANNDPDEMLLCPAVNATSGACFFNKPINIAQCRKWTAEFDYRIWGGSGADGISFSFLANPPTGFVPGGGVGIPTNPQGLMVVLDQFDNGCGTNPELQLFFGTGNSNYNECAVNVRQTNVGLVRQSNYNRCKITYNNGQIDVFINGTNYISGNFNTNFTGFLGFTSSTGGSNDNHSIRNVVIYTSIPPSDAGQDQTICSGDSVQIGTSPKPNFSYSWSPTTGLSNPNAANPKVSLTNTTNSPIQQQYIVTTDSANIGCTSTDTMALTVYPASTAIAGNDTVICSGGTATLQASGGASYQWSNGANSASTQVTPSSTTIYRVTVTDANGCTATDSVKVMVSPPITASLTTSLFQGGFEISCNGGSDGNIDLTVNGGTSPYTYSWNGGQFQTKDIQNLTAGNYQVSVTDSNGCTVTADKTLTEPPPLSSSFIVSTFPGGYNINCFGNADGMINLTVNGGTQPYSYSWNGGQFQTRNLNNVPAGIYSVTVTDANGCQTTRDTTLTEPAPLVINDTVSQFNGGFNVSCNGNSDGSIAISTNGGHPPYSYNWNNNAFTTKNLDSIPAGPYSLTVTDSNGCTATFDTTLSEPPPLTSTLTPSTFTGGLNISCSAAADGAIDLEVNGGATPYNFSWNGGNFTSEDINGVNAGKYRVLITDNNGCTHRDSLTLQAPPALQALTQQENVTCFDGSDGKASVQPSGGTSPYSYEWSNGGMDSAVQSLSAGTVRVTITDANNCQLEETVTIAQPPEPVIDLPKRDTINFGDTTQIQPDYFSNGNDASFQWSPADALSCTDCAAPFAFPIQTTAYQVGLTDEDGCETSSSTTIVVLQEKDLFIPNAFTPDGDGLNDTFKVFTKGLQSSKMKIYARWGDKVFETTDVTTKGWDGFINNEKAPAGVYVYTVSLRYQDGTKDRQKGSVTLLR